MANPKWWNEEHESTWTRVKGAMKRDWEQTKSDLSGNRKGRDIDQDVGDTVKQAMGKPSATAPEWDRVESGYRYGVGARAQFGREYTEWDDRLESRLRNDWDETKSGSTWEDVKAAVRRGWERVRD